jgi:hypothetical protein
MIKGEFKMIEAFLAAFPTLYEGEDIEIRYCIIQGEVPIKKETIYSDYLKPSVVGISAVLTLLTELDKYKESEITIMIKDDALYEIIRGTSTTQKGEVLKMASKMKKALAKFESLSFINVTNKDKTLLSQWKENLGIY